MQVLACEQCRKRKVRCSGNAPCTNCERHMTACHFELTRRRRGPRPKQRPDANPNSNTVHLPADNDNIPNAAPISQSRATAPERPQPTSPPRRRSILHTAFGVDRVSAWKSGLSKIMGGDRYTINSISVSVDQALHLVLIFCDTINNQQSPVLSVTKFLTELEEGRPSRQLCHAMCAAGMQFSRHQMSLNTSLSAAYATDSREELSSSQEVSDYARLQQLLTLAVLSLHETHQGNGMQAWYDITVSMNLVCFVKLSASAGMDDDLSQNLEIVHRYLCVAETLHFIGQPTPPPKTSLLLNPKLSPEISSSKGSLASHEMLLSRLLKLFPQCLSLCRNDFLMMIPAPWASESKFMAVKKELDMVMVMHAGDLSMADDNLDALRQLDVGAGEYVLSLLMFHVMVILLNRSFMGVGVIPIGAANAQSRTGANTAARSTTWETNIGAREDGARSGMQPTTRKAVYFPGAPPSFCQERVAACVGSARRVTLLCESILVNETLLLPPFLGYAMFLSGLVFLNELRLDDNVVRRSEYVGHLKTIFTVLAAMRPLFDAAHLWADALFRAHALGLPVESPRSSTSLFTTFFARFPGVAEPPYCRLHNAEPDSVQSRPSKGINTTQGRDSSTDNAPPTERNSINGDMRGAVDVDRDDPTLTKRNGDTSSDSHPLSDYANAIENFVDSMSADEDDDQTQDNEIARGEEVELVTAEPPISPPDSESIVVSRPAQEFEQRIEPNPELPDSDATDSLNLDMGWTVYPPDFAQDHQLSTTSNHDQVMSFLDSEVPMDSSLTESLNLDNIGQIDYLEAFYAVFNL